MPAKQNQINQAADEQDRADTDVAKKPVKKTVKPGKSAVNKAKGKTVVIDAISGSEAGGVGEKNPSPTPKKRKITVRNKNIPKIAPDKKKSPQIDTAANNTEKDEANPDTRGKDASKKSQSASVLKEVNKSYGEKTEVKPVVSPMESVSDKTAPQTKTVNEILREPNSTPIAAPVADNNEIEQAIRRRRSIRMYRKIALVFIALTAGLLAVIFYFSFVKVTITLIPNQERVSNSMIIDIIDRDQTKQPALTAIKGVVKPVDIEFSKTYPATGAVVIGEEAVGKVKIINNYDKNQPLVATTRLLAPDSKLFRIKETVNVPAGGTVEVDIYADKPGEDMAIGPTKFSIPGLWAGLQDKIFAESTEPVDYRQKVKSHITQEDIDNSRRDLRQELLAEAKKEVSKTYENFSQIIYKIDENTIKSGAEARAGEEKEDFSATMQAKVAVVAFDEKDAALLAKQKLLASLASNKELIRFDESEIIYSLDNYNHNEGEASISATFEGRTSLKDDSDIVELEKILGLNEEQLNTYLKGLPEIAGFEVKFFPVFVKRVPKLIDRIEVVVKK